jgi:hypothetical protein
MNTSIYPDEWPEPSGSCAECGGSLGELPVELRLNNPHMKPAIKAYVCSRECRSEYLQGYADYLIEER